jgi:hypothetical protein
MIPAVGAASASGALGCRGRLAGRTPVVGLAMTTPPFGKPLAGGLQLLLSVTPQSPLRSGARLYDRIEHSAIDFGAPEGGGISKALPRPPAVNLRLVPPVRAL